MSFVREAYFFSIPLILVAVISLLTGFLWPGLFLLVLAAFVAFFFRDPERQLPGDPDAILSPADGKVIRIRREGDRPVVCIFLSVFNVHVNRSPVDGKVERSEHRKGKFHLAFDDRASVENEQHVFTIGDVTFALIAGLVARRIIPWKSKGDMVRRGDRIALIRFGSRVDLIVPPNADVVVSEGDRVRAGSSILARRKGGR